MKTLPQKVGFFDLCPGDGMEDMQVLETCAKSMRVRISPWAHSPNGGKVYTSDLRSDA